MSANLPIKKNFGAQLYKDAPQLSRQLDEMYTDIAFAVNQLIKKYVTQGADAPANAQLNSLFNIGDIYVRTDTNKAWIMTSRTSPNIVNWQIIT
jgi:hypothetical protein